MSVMSRYSIHSVLGANQVLRNTVVVEVSAFLEKRYECVRLNVISVTRGWLGGG